MKLLETLHSAEVFELICAFQLGLGTMFMYTGFDTHSFILESVLHSVHERNPDQIDKYAGYFGQAVNYIFFMFANFFSPLLIAYMNSKWSLFIGSLCFTLYQLGFLYVNTYYFYGSAALMGIGFAVFYAGNGCYLTEHSTKRNMARNSSISYGIACCGMSVGGIVLLITFHSETSSSSNGRYREYSNRMIRAIFGTFSAISVLSNITFLLLSKRKPENSVGDEIGWQNDKRGLSETLKSTLKLFVNRNVWLLSWSWIYLGILTSFMLGVYPTSLIFTQCLSKSNTLIPLYALAFGLGEISTAIFVSVISRRYVNFGRIPSAAFGCVTNIAVYILVLLSTPRYSSLKPNNDEALLIPPNFYIPLLCGYFLGIGDCFWNTARSCIIPALLPESRGEGFAVSKFFQSFSSGGLYFLSSLIDLYAHFGILISTCILSMVTFVIAARRDTQRVKKVYCSNTTAPEDSFSERK